MIEISGETLEILSEYQRRRDHVINKYQPSEQNGHNQLSYHKSNARYRLLFGGNQSGKSHAAAFDCAVNARGRNNFNLDSNITGRSVEIWVISTEYATIKNGIYRHLKNILPSWDIIHEGPMIPTTNLPSFLKVKRKDGFETVITFMSAKGENRQKFQAAAVDYFYIDEEIPPYLWEELEVRTLATGGKFSISATLVESYEWIMQLEKQAEQGDPYVFLTRLNTELNPYLDKEVVNYLKSKFSNETLEYRFYGKARQASGLIYKNFDKDKHIIEPFEIPLDWPRWNAIDPGIRTCAALWIAVGPNDRAYAYRELYAHNEPLWEVARVIKKLEGYKYDEELSHKFEHYVFEETERSEKMVVRLIDPKSRARSEAGEISILEQLHSRYGLLCCLADNSLRPGIEDCRFWLQDLKDKLPGIQFFNTLDNFFEERRTYRFRPLTGKTNQNAPIEDPIRRHNHLMDTFRYIARQRPRYSHKEQLPGYEPIESAAERIKRNQSMEEYSELLGYC